MQMDRGGQPPEPSRRDRSTAREVPGQFGQLVPDRRYGNLVIIRDHVAGWVQVGHPAGGPTGWSSLANHVRSGTIEPSQDWQRDRDMDGNRVPSRVEAFPRRVQTTTHFNGGSRGSALWVIASFAHSYVRCD
jgi:hypothetical protein